MATKTISATATQLRPEETLNEFPQLRPEEISNEFQQLVRDLSDILGPSSGLDSGDVDPNRIVELMRSYESVLADWEKYAMADLSRPYTRNLVDKGNGKSNLLVLVWSPGKSSPIHDHADAHCVMKVLYGTLKETLYAWPDALDRSGRTSSPPEVKRVTVLKDNNVTYMSDALGLHRVGNPDPERLAVSLHCELRTVYWTH